MSAKARNLITRLLSDPASPILSEGRRPRPDQLRYALSVLRGLEHDERLSIIQAETGVGKTLGYIIAAAVNAIGTEKRVIISTHSISLQQQVMGALSEISDTLDQIYRRPVRVALRVGRRNLLSKRQFLELKEKFLGSNSSPRPNDLLALDLIEAWFDNLPVLIPDMGNPLDGGWDPRLPMRRDLEALLEDQELISPIPIGEMVIQGSNRDAPEYQRMCDRARSADILVVNHALVGVDLLTFGRVLDLNGAHGSPATTLIVDEADEMIGMFSNLLSARTPFSEILSLLKGLYDPEKVPEPFKIMDRMELLAERFRSRVEYHIRPIPGSGFGINLNEKVPHLRSIRGALKPLLDMLPLLGRVRDLISAASGPDDDEALEVLEEIDTIHTALRKVLDGDGGADPIIFYWSERLGKPGLATCRMDPQSLMRRLIHSDNPDLRVVMTSATITTKKSGSGNSFMSDFAFEIGLSRTGLERIVTDSISPRHFGNMSFMTVPPGSVPPVFLPCGRHDEIPPLNPEHIRMVLKLAGEISKRGERVLILVPSYRDIRVYGSLLGLPFTQDFMEDVILDSPKTHRSAIDRFRNNERAILISPAVWSGMDLPGLVKNIFIPRIPTPPIDTVRDGMSEMLFRALGKDEKFIEGMRFRVARIRAKRRLRQGMGRGIRGEDDDTCIWMLDPRWPYPAHIGALNRGSRNADLREAIPSRFLEFHEDMGVFDPYGDVEEVPA